MNKTESFHPLLSVLLGLLILPCAIAYAQNTSSLLQDHSSSAFLEMLAYGDSLTFGVGDGIEPNEIREQVPVPLEPRGYPARLEALVGIEVQNRGVPGDILSDPDGLVRFPTSLASSNAQIILIFEGENDAIFRVSQEEFSTNLQKLINIAQHQKRSVILATLPPPCCDRKERADFTRGYSRVIRRLSIINNTHLADVERAWDIRCPVAKDCDLVNRPEGLHPNTLGYDFLAQLFAATIIGIDIFEPGSLEELAEALDLPQEKILLISNSSNDASE